MSHLVTAQSGAPNAGSNYRYGMNGQEKDNEIFEGAYTAEFWEYDSRTGRRWNVDPIVKCHESPYATFANNPIFVVDINGDTGDPNKKDGTLNTVIYLYKDGNVTDEDFKKVVEGFQNINSFKFPNYNGKQVSANVTVHVVQTPKTVDQLLPGENFFIVQNTGISGVDGTRSMGIINVRTLGENTILHEWGHLFGLIDRYLPMYPFYGKGEDTHKIDSRDDSRLTIPLDMQLPYDTEYNPYTNLYSSASGKDLTSYQMSVFFGDNLIKEERHYPGVVIFYNSDNAQLNSKRHSAVIFDAIRISKAANGEQKIEGVRKDIKGTIGRIIYATSKDSPNICDDREHHRDQKDKNKEIIKNNR